MNFKKCLLSLAVLVCLLGGAAGAQARMHGPSGKFIFLNLNTKFWSFLQQRTILRRTGAQVGYGLNLGGRGSYGGYFGVGVDTTAAFSGLGVVLRYGYEFMRHAPFALGLSLNVSPSYVVSPRGINIPNNSRIFVPYELEVSGNIKLTHAAALMLRLGFGSVLFPVVRRGRGIVWPVPTNFGLSAGFRYYL